MRITLTSYMQNGEKVERSLAIYFALVCCLIPLTTLPVETVAAAPPASNIQILSLTPAPNYPRTTDPLDIQQLTDGTLENHPMWLRKGGVGWARLTPIIIKMRVSSPGSGTGAVSGILRLHTGKQIASGVTPPKRIDVYSGIESGGYSRVNGVQIQDAKFSDRSSHWIELPLTGASRVFLVVVHAGSDYFFLDEIQWIPTANKPSNQAGATIATPESVVADSLSNLKRSFLSTATPPAAMPPDSTGAGRQVDPILMWAQDPWGQFEAYPNRDEVMRRKGQPILLLGTKDEFESGCLGVMNTSSDVKEVRLQINQRSDRANGIQLRLVKKVLAANGNFIFDALTPIGSDEVIVLPPGVAMYFWITADLGRYCCGQSEVFVQVKDKATSADFQLPLQVAVADHSLSNKHVSAVNWAYTSDKPIWANPPAVVNDLTAHGINVFVIPPWILPQPSLKGGWDVYRARRFEETVGLFRGRGMLLLFMGLNAGSDSSDQKPNWLYSSNSGANPTHKSAMREWLTTLTLELGKLGFSKKDWALYPIDEARGEDLTRLQRIASMVKEIDPSVQLYANPDSTTDTAVTRDHLEALKPLIDIWQPNLLLASSSGKEFFQNLHTPWWIYSNASTPAKAASPLNHYRAMSLRAWTLGAEGVGFWSYSDTAGTSAWDDLDGARPDWAVVYENDTPSSSRRWEAFREGLDDHRLLQSAVTDNPRLSPSEKEARKDEMRRLAAGLLTTAQLQRNRLQLLRLIQSNFVLDMNLDTLQ